MVVPALEQHALRAERRNEVVAGLTLAGTVLVVGYASGLGHLLGTAIPRLPVASAQSSSTVQAVPVTAPATAQTAGSPRRSPARALAVGPRSRSAGADAAAPARFMSLAVPGTGSACEPSLDAAIVDPFWMHLEKGHLEESPGQQVADLLDVDRYVRTHTVLVEDMADPVATAADHSLDAAGTFWMHLEKGHFEESPGEQAGDMLDPDRYVRTHTALLEDMLAPTADELAGTC